MSDVREACPDTGTCGHLCPIESGKGAPCWRVLYAGPLSLYGMTWREDDRVMARLWQATLGSA